MGKFTGKSDFHDWCEMHNNPNEVVEKADVYLGNAKVEIKDENDLIPYYTNLIGSMSSSDGHQVIHLTQNSFIDDEEGEFMAHKIIDVISWAKRAKKLKVPLTYEFVKKQKEFWSDEDPVWKSIIKVVNENPDIIKFHINKDYRKACSFAESYLIPHYFSHIHDAMHNRYREEFVKFCSENGYQAFSWNFETGEVGYQNQGKHHPLIWKLCWEIGDYHKMVKEFKND